MKKWIKTCLLAFALATPFVAVSAEKNNEALVFARGLVESLNQQYNSGLQSPYVVYSWCGNPISVVVALADGNVVPLPIDGPVTVVINALLAYENAEGNLATVDLGRINGACVAL